MTDTLRSICEQSIHLNNPQLDFFPATLARHKEIISRDLRELVSVASCENEKACAILAGSLLEAVLFSFIQWQEAQIAALEPGFKFKPKENLQFYLDKFNKHFGSNFPKLQLPNSLVGYRNLVHINRELNVPPGECRKAAETLLRTLDALLGGLADFGRVAP